MANFELDPEFFLPPGHNIVDGGVDWLPRTFTTPAVPITRCHERFVIATVHPAPPADEVIQVRQEVDALLLHQGFHVRSAQPWIEGVGLFELRDAAESYATIHMVPQPLANSVVRFIRHDHGLGFRGQEGFRQGCLMLLGVPLDYRNTEDLRAAVNTFGEFHHWVQDDPYLVRSIVFAAFPEDRLVPRSISFSEYSAWGGARVSWSAPVYILGTATAEILPNDEDPMPLNGNPHPLPGQLVHDNLQFSLPPYPALGWNAVPLAPGDPGPAAADADEGGWGQPPIDLEAGDWGQPPADGGGWEHVAAPAAPADTPAVDPGLMVEEPVVPELPLHLPDAANIDVDVVDAAVLADAPDNAGLEAGVDGHIAGRANRAELEAEDPRLEEEETNPLAMVLYTAPPPDQSNITVEVPRVLYGPPLPPLMSWTRTFENLMGPAAALHIPCQFQMPLLEPILIPKRSRDVAFDADTPGPSLSDPASASLSIQEVSPISPASSSEDLSFRSPAPSKKGSRKKVTPMVDSLVRRCTRGSIKRDGFKPTLHELPAHIPKKRKPKAKPMPSTSQESDDVPPATPIPVLQEVGQSLGIAPEKLTVDRLMEDPDDSAPKSSDV
uniref:DUF7597 domain-containing protein n=1 Tax=Hordeum vulgare subsp. vulgare TaxID=112509 RepID=A0A8I6Y7E8_HORVV